MKPTIFYFDDEPALLDNFQEMFGEQYEVRTTTTLSEARRILAECAPDIVISDQQMPEIDGADFLREVACRNPDGLRIMVTGYTSISSVMIEISMGIINIFVPKPWTQEHMRQVLERANSLVTSSKQLRLSQKERRIAPRRKVRLETGVLMMAAGVSVEGGEQMITLTGHTYDISESGIGLVITSKDMQALSSFGFDYTLQLVLTLPSGPIELVIAPVRHQPLNEGKEYLIGAQITDMNGRDRVRFMEYIG